MCIIMKQCVGCKLNPFSIIMIFLFCGYKKLATENTAINNDIVFLGIIGELYDCISSSISRSGQFILELEIFFQMLGLVILAELFQHFRLDFFIVVDKRGAQYALNALIGRSVEYFPVDLCFYSHR